MIMILDFYDLIRRVKNHLKVKKSLSLHGSGPHPCDIPNVTYQVINHKKGEALKVDFVINPTLLTSKTIITEKTYIPK